jgi:ATP adenylyltransferase
MSPEKDAENLILARSELCLLMLNKYPYVNGHLLVAPYRHAPTPAECTPEERAQTMELLVLGQPIDEAYRQLKEAIEALTPGRSNHGPQ